MIIYTKYSQIYPIVQMHTIHPLDPDLVCFSLYLCATFSLPADHLARDPARSQYCASWADSLPSVADRFQCCRKTAWGKIIFPKIIQLVWSPFLCLSLGSSCFGLRGSSFEYSSGIYSRPVRGFELFLIILLYDQRSAPAVLLNGRRPILVWAVRKIVGRKGENLRYRLKV